METYEKLLLPLHGRIWLKRESQAADRYGAAEIAAKIAEAIAAGRCPRCDSPMQEPFDARPRESDIAGITVCAACQEGEARGEPSLEALLSWGFRPADWMREPFAARPRASDVDDIRSFQEGEVDGEPSLEALLSWGFRPADWGDS